MKNVKHKNIVQCYSLLQHTYQKQYYLILERIDVPTLEFHLKNQPKLTE